MAATGAHRTHKKRHKTSTTENPTTESTQEMGGATSLERRKGNGKTRRFAGEKEDEYDGKEWIQQKN